MPSPLAHTAMGYLFLSRDQKRDLLARLDWKPFAVLALFANLPDFDLVLGLLTGNLGRFHHGKWVAHSFGAAVLAAAAVWIVLRLMGRSSAGRWSLACLLLYASHIALDFFSQDTGAPFGQMIFWPLSHQHFLSPVSVFSEIQRGAGVFFAAHNLRAILWEAALFAPFVLATSWRPMRAAWAARSGCAARAKPARR